jgi:hypothetical protein
MLVVSSVLWPARAIRAPRIASRPARVLRDRMTQAGLHSVTIPTLLAVSILLAVAAAAFTFAIVPVLALAVIAFCL